MQIVERIKRAPKRLATAVVVRLSPVRKKRNHELSYWRGKQKAEGVLSNDHYRHFYTAHFGLDGDFYRDKTVLDIGCGPRGSLEWASMAARRIGLDPLVEEYRKLGADRHRMEYIRAASERIPLADASCDAVFSFNSFDHVEDVERTAAEIKRVAKPGSLFLLLAEVNHPPTVCEPHQLTPLRLRRMFGPEFRCEDLQVYRPAVAGLYQSIAVGDRVSDPDTTAEAGYLSARFVRQ